jgi:hypothetical protein
MPSVLNQRAEMSQLMGGNQIRGRAPRLAAIRLILPSPQIRSNGHEFANLLRQYNDYIAPL